MLLIPFGDLFRNPCDIALLSSSVSDDIILRRRMFANDSVVYYTSALVQNDREGGTEGGQGGERSWRDPL